MTLRTLYRQLPAATLAACVAVLAGGCANQDGSLLADVDEPPGQDDVAPEPESPPSLLCEVSADPVPLSDEELQDPGPYAVISSNTTYFDQTRPTAANGPDYAGSDERKLAVSIHRPMSADGGPYPLVVYNHGFSSLRLEGQPLGRHLASHGYVVIAADFPLSNVFAPGGPTLLDVVNQPGDVSFLIDRLLAESATPGEDLEGMIDADRIAVVGLSLGALTTSLVTYHPDLLDPRIKAAVTLAGPSFAFSEAFYAATPHPLLVVHGDLDALVPYELNAATTLERAAPNARVVTIHGGSHAGYFPFPEPLLNLVSSVFPDAGDVSNPDAIGCVIVGEQINDQAGSGDGIGALLGDEADGILPASELVDLPLPCNYGLYDQPALATEVQSAITRRSVLSFLNAHLDNDSQVRTDNCNYLENLLQADPNVGVE